MGKRTDFTQDEINSKVQRIYALLLNERLPVYDCKNCDIEEMLVKVPHFPGLIVLCEEIDGKERIVFIGESNNVNGRCTQYFSDKIRNATLKRLIGDALINIEIKKESLSEQTADLWWDYENEARFNIAGYKEIENRYIEEVRNYIKNHLSFRIIRMDKEHRSFAWKLLATLLKTNSFSSNTWLGNHATHSEVKKSGMWGMRQFTSNKIMQEEDFKLLEKLICGKR